MTGKWAFANSHTTNPQIWKWRCASSSFGDREATQNISEIQKKEQRNEKYRTAKTNPKVTGRFLLSILCKYGLF